MRGYGNVPLLETVEVGTMLICDKKTLWLRALRVGETNFIGIACERIEAGWTGRYIFMDDEEPQDVMISCGNYSQYHIFLPNFQKHLNTLGKRQPSLNVEGTCK